MQVDGTCYHQPEQTPFKMKPLLFLANAFINTFGITQPTPEAADRAAKFIAALIGLAIAGMIAVGVAILYLLTRS